MNRHGDAQRTIGRVRWHACYYLDGLAFPRGHVGAYAGGIDDGVLHSLECTIGVWSNGADPAVAVGFSIRFGRRFERFVPRWLWRG